MNEYQCHFFDLERLFARGGDGRLSSRSRRRSPSPQLVDFPSSRSRSHSPDTSASLPNYAFAVLRLVLEFAFALFGLVSAFVVGVFAIFFGLAVLDSPLFFELLVSSAHFFELLV